MNLIVVLTCFVLADMTFTQGKYVLVELEKPKGRNQKFFNHLFLNINSQYPILLFH